MKESMNLVPRSCVDCGKQVWCELEDENEPLCQECECEKAYEEKEK